MENDFLVDMLVELRAVLPKAKYIHALEIYQQIWDMESRGKMENEFIAELAKFDRFFLLTEILRTHYARHPWVYARCREVEADPDDHLDLWARGHFKSTVITFGGAFQEIIRDREITIGIFSNDRLTAKKFLAQFKTEIEENPALHKYWPDIFWQTPKSEAPKWSLDDGLILQRAGNPREPTIGAYGLIEAQPTGSHFRLRIYDDTVTEGSVSNPEMIAKTTERWELSQNLAVTAVQGSDVIPRQWHIGTRYHYADTYGVLLKRKAFKPRVYPATDDGTIDGAPVLLTSDEWEKKKQRESLFTIACQQLLNPVAGSLQEFKLEWMRKYEIRPQTLNVAILVDPADSKAKDACRTAFAVIGLDAQKNKYLLDGACHRMTLSERWVMLKNLRAKWLKQPGVQVVRVGYERYGMQADIQHFQTMMQIEGRSFSIEEVSWVRQGSQEKDQRIRRLEPDHRNWRFFYPHEGSKATKLQHEAQTAGRGYLIAKPIKRVDENGRVYNLVQYLIDNEYLFFPAGAKDLMDAMSRFYDLEMAPPRLYKESDLIPEAAGMM